MASSSGQAGKLLFQAQSPHQISSVALQSVGMHNFEEATNRKEVLTQSQQHMLALRNPNYLMQRGSKKELLKSDDYSRAHGSGDSSPQLHGGNMSPEYYSRQRVKGSKQNSPEASTISATAHALHL